MDKVISYEQKRISWWIGRSVAVVAFALLLFLVISYIAINKINSLESWDLLTLFWEDPEIISSFWKDTLLTFWIELPKTEFYFLVFLIASIIIWWATSANERNKMHKKIAGLAKYQKSGTIKPSNSKEVNMMKKYFMIVTLIAIAALLFFAIKTNKTEKNSNGEIVIPTSAPLSASLTPEAQIFTLVIHEPSIDAIVREASVTVKGTTSPGAEVFINDKETIADAKGNFSISIALDEGENYILVTANDTDGNYKEVELTITYETI